MPNAFDVVIDARARLKHALVAQMIVATSALAAIVAVLVQTLPQLLNTVP